VKRTARVELIFGKEHYDALVLGTILKARTSVWIATANVKEMMHEAPIGSAARARGKFVSILESLRDMAKRGVEIRLLHAGAPSGPFRAALAKHRPLAEPHFEMRQCPRVHLKIIAADGAKLYLGSANFTGAGLGAKGEGRRNFELGMLTDDDVLLDQTQAHFDAIWRGKECASCKIRPLCPRPLDTPAKATRPRRVAPKKTV
jgi:hypothetical protein